METQIKSKKESLVLVQILQKIVPQIRATVLMEPEWNVTGQITFKSGRRSYFRYNTLDLNPVGASEIARDKDYANFFMKTMGYPTVPDSKTFFSDSWAKAIGAVDRKIDAAFRYAQRVGFPVILKPNSGSRGNSIFLVYNETEFYTAMTEVFKSDRVALVQKYVQGQDFRVLVLDNKVFCAYERRPLGVIGNGISTIRQLLEAKQKQFVLQNRNIKINVDDIRLETKLAHQNLDFDSIPLKDQEIILLDNANLSSGGDAVDVSDFIHPEFKQLAIKLTKDMGLRLCGIDLMVKGDISQPPEKYWILEINASPGLDHYAKLGPHQQIIVENLYIEVLKQLDN